MTKATNSSSFKWMDLYKDEKSKTTKQTRGVISLGYLSRRARKGSARIKKKAVLRIAPSTNQKPDAGLLDGDFPNERAKRRQRSYRGRRKKGEISVAVWKGEKRG